MKVFIKNYWVVALLFLAISCSKLTDEINPQDSYRYFPIEVGNFNVFQVISKTYAVGQKARIDTVLRKEIVKSKTIDQSTINYVIERQEKGKNDLYYKAVLVYQVITDPSKVVVGERNIYTVLLKYPIYKGAKWNVNEINGQDTSKSEIVKYDSLPPKLITKNNLIKVLGADSTNNFINFKVKYHLFAKDIGLIYSEKTEIEYCQDNDENPKTSCTGKFIIESGKREFITLMETGKLIN